MTSQDQVARAVAWTVEHSDWIRLFYNYYWLLLPLFTCGIWLLCCVANTMRWAWYNPRGCLYVSTFLAIASLLFWVLFPYNVMAFEP